MRVLALLGYLTQKKKIIIVSDLISDKRIRADPTRSDNSRIILVSYRIRVMLIFIVF